MKNHKVVALRPPPGGSVDLEFGGGYVEVVAGYPDGACTSEDTDEAIVHLYWNQEADWDEPLFSLILQLPPLKEHLVVCTEESLGTAAHLWLAEAEQLRDALTEMIEQARRHAAT